MIRRAVMLAAVVMPVAALAQAQAPAAITATPLMPPSMQYSPALPAPQPISPPPTDQSQAQPAPPAPSTTPAAPPPMQLTWLPQASALVQVLDKINAQSTVLTVKVGQQAEVGTLNIQVQACNTHPPDQAQDAAAYLTITDSHADTPSFHGWMLANNPSLSMLQNPIYDVRVVGCRA
jgi:hypothetical protein